MVKTKKTPVKSVKGVIKKKNTTTKSTSKKQLKKVKEGVKRQPSSRNSKSRGLPSPPLKSLTPVERPLKTLTPVEQATSLSPVESSNPISQRKKRKNKEQVVPLIKGKTKDLKSDKKSSLSSRKASSSSVQLKSETPRELTLKKNVSPKTVKREPKKEAVKRETKKDAVKREPKKEEKVYNTEQKKSSTWKESGNHRSAPLSKKERISKLSATVVRRSSRSPKGKRTLPSPKRRSLSPRRTLPSPKRRSHSPAPRVPVTKRSLSPRSRRRSRSPVRSKRRSRSPLQSRKRGRSPKSRFSSRRRSHSPQSRFSSRRSLSPRSRKRSLSSSSRVSRRKRFSSTRSPSYRRRTEDRVSRNYTSAPSHKSRRERRERSGSTKFSRRSREKSREKERSRFRLRSRDRSGRSRSRNRSSGGRGNSTREKTTDKSKTSSRFEDKVSERRFPLKIESIGIDRSRNMRRNRVPFERPGERPSFTSFASRFSDGPKRSTAFSDKTKETKFSSAGTKSQNRKEKTEEEFIRDEEEELVEVEKKWEEEEKKADLEYVNSEIARSLKRLSKTVEGRTPTPSPESDSDDEPYNRQRAAAEIALSMMAGINDRVVERGPRRSFHSGPIPSGVPVQFQTMQNLHQIKPISSTVPVGRQTPFANSSVLGLSNQAAGSVNQTGGTLPNTSLSTNVGTVGITRGGGLTANQRGGLNQNSCVIQANPRGVLANSHAGALNSNRGFKPTSFRGRGVSHSHITGLPNLRRGIASGNRGGSFTSSQGRGVINNSRGGKLNDVGQGLYSGRGRGFSNNMGRGASGIQRGFTETRAGLNNSFRGGFKRNVNFKGGLGFNNPTDPSMQLGISNRGRGQIIQPQVGLQHGNLNRCSLSLRGDNYGGGRFSSSNSSRGRNNRGGSRFVGDQQNSAVNRQTLNLNIDSRLQQGSNISQIGRERSTSAAILSNSTFSSNRGGGFGQTSRGGFNNNRGTVITNHIPGGTFMQTGLGRGFVPNNQARFNNNSPDNIRPARKSRFEQNSSQQQFHTGSIRGGGVTRGRGGGHPGRGGPTLPTWYKAEEQQPRNEYIHPSRRKMVPNLVPQPIYSNPYGELKNSQQNYRGTVGRKMQMAPPITVDGYASRHHPQVVPQSNLNSRQPYTAAIPNKSPFDREKVISSVFKYIDDNCPKIDEVWRWKGIPFSELVTHLKQEFAFITPNALFVNNWNQFFENMSKNGDFECLDVLPEGPSMRKKYTGLASILFKARKALLELIQLVEPKDEEQKFLWEGVELDVLKEKFLQMFDFRDFGYKRFTTFIKDIPESELIMENDKCNVRMKLVAKPKSNTVQPVENLKERIEKIISMRTREPWAVKQQMISQFADGVVKEKVSLRDPYTAGFMKIPCKGLQCTHRQAFDLEVFLKMTTNSKKKPSCPICQKLVSEETIWVDGYWLKVCQQWVDLDPESCVLHLDGRVSLESGEEFDPAPSPPSASTIPQNVPKKEPTPPVKIEDQPQYIQHHYKKKQEKIKFRVNFSKLKDVVTAGGEEVLQQTTKELQLNSNNYSASKNNSSNPPRQLKRRRTRRTEEESNMATFLPEQKKSNEGIHVPDAQQRLDEQPPSKKLCRSTDHNLHEEYNDIFGIDIKSRNDPPLKRESRRRACYNKPSVLKSDNFANVDIPNAKPFVDTRIRQQEQLRSEARTSDNSFTSFTDTRLGDTRLRGNSSSPIPSVSSQIGNRHPDNTLSRSVPHSYEQRPSAYSPHRYSDHNYHHNHGQLQNIRHDSLKFGNPCRQGLSPNRYPRNQPGRFNEPAMDACPDPEPGELNDFDMKPPPQPSRNKDPSTDLGASLLTLTQVLPEAVEKSKRPDITVTSNGFK